MTPNPSRQPTPGSAFSSASRFTSLTRRVSAERYAAPLDHHERFKNIDDAVFGVILCVTGLIGFVLLSWTLYFLFAVGDFIGMPHYPSAIICLASLIAVVVGVRWQLRRDLLVWWGYLALLAACVWAFIVYFSLPVHDAIHVLLGIAECDGSDDYSVASLTPLCFFVLTSLFAVIRWISRYERVKRAA